MERNSDDTQTTGKQTIIPPGSKEVPGYGGTNNIYNLDPQIKTTKNALSQYAKKIKKIDKAIDDMKRTINTDENTLLSYFKRTISNKYTDKIPVLGKVTRKLVVSTADKTLGGYSSEGERLLDYLEESTTKLDNLYDNIIPKDQEEIRKMGNDLAESTPGLVERYKFIGEEIVKYRKYFEILNEQYAKASEGQRPKIDFERKLLETKLLEKSSIQEITKKQINTINNILIPSIGEQNYRFEVERSKVLVLKEAFKGKIPETRLIAKNLNAFGNINQVKGDILKKIDQSYKNLNKEVRLQMEKSKLLDDALPFIVDTSIIDEKTRLLIADAYKSSENALSGNLFGTANKTKLLPPNKTTKNKDKK